MEKNKNRTDLLAAGRKKLQQFRQKKDSKGHSKALSKAGKSGRDATAGTASEATATQQHTADGEIPQHDVEDAVTFSESSSRVNSVASTTSDKSGHDLTVGTSTESEVAQKHDSDGDRSKHDAEDIISLSESSSRVESVVTDTAVSESVRDKVAGITSEAVAAQQHAADQERYSHDGADDTIAMSEANSRVDSVAINYAAAASDELSAKDAIEISSLAGPAESPPEGSGIDDTRSYQSADDGHGVDSGIALKDGSSSLVPEDAKNNVPIMILNEKSADSSISLPIDFSSGLEHGEEQVTDVGAMQEVVNSSPLLGGDGSPPSNDLSESTEVLKVANSVETPEEEEIHVAQLTKPGDATLADAAFHDDGKGQEGDTNSVVIFPLTESGMVSTVSSVVNGHPRDDRYSDSNEQKSEALDASGDNVGLHSEGTNTSSGFVDVERLSEFLSNHDAESLACKQVDLSSVLDGSVIKLSQLAEVLRLLDEDEFRFLFMSKELSLDKLMDSSKMRAHDSALHDTFERFKEHLYVTSFSKDAFHSQLFEHQKWIDEINSSLTEVQEKNEILTKEILQCRYEHQEVVAEREELHKQLQLSKAGHEVFSAKANEMQNKLEISQGELSSISSELVGCRSLVEALEAENEKLNDRCMVLAEEKNLLSEENGKILLENEKMAENLSQSNASLESLQALLRDDRKLLEEQHNALVLENSKLLADLAESKGTVEALEVKKKTLNDTLTYVSEERKKLEEEKISAVHQSEKISKELIDCQDLVATLQTEISNLNDHLTSVTEERIELEEEKNKISSELDKQSLELMEIKILEAALQAECTRCLNDLKVARTHVNQLTEENETINADLEFHKLKLKELGQEKYSSQFEEVATRGIENITLQKPKSELPSLDQRKLDVYDDSSGFVALKRNLEDAIIVMQELEKEIEGMHVTYSKRSSDKVAAPGVSRLIQAFESKNHDEDQGLEKPSLSEVQSSEELYMRTKMVAENLKVWLRELVNDAANASDFCRAMQSKSVDAARIDRIKYDSLKEHTDQMEGANIELMVLFEVMKVNICHALVKEGELLHVCDVLQKQEIVLKSENSQLQEKLNDFQVQIIELQTLLDGFCRNSDEMVSSISNQLQTLQAEVADRESILEEEWNSVSSQVLHTVAMLDSTIKKISANSIAAENSKLDVVGCVAASVDGASKFIEGLHGQLKAAHRDSQEMSDKTDVVLNILHRLYSELSQLVRRSLVYYPDEAENIVADDKVLDLLDPDVFDTLLEQLKRFHSQRMELESENKQLSSELRSRARVQKNCLKSDAILRLIEEIENSVRLEGTIVNEDEPVVLLESLIHSLVQKYREAVQGVGLCASLEMQLSDLRGQVEHLSFNNVQYENENLVFKHSLKSAEEEIVALNSRLQEKVAELGQSEHRVSSLREKLGIAVTKGKGLISQRDSLKQSLAETSKELEKCSQELLSKDAILHELETKLKVYSEAGERMEALESELSYIRNSATALRESFLLKDSVLQRIEEILEDLELPEYFHSRDIIEKIDWLAKSVGGNSLPLGDWDQRSLIGGGSHSDAGFGGADGLKEDMQPNTNSSDDLRRRYEELQNKFYGLAEQNEMLEQSLMERNNLVQRWEEVLDKMDMPSQLRSMEPEDKIHWLESALSEAQNYCYSLQQRIDNLETSCGSLTADVEDSRKRTSELEVAFQQVCIEKENLLKDVEILRHDNDESSKGIADLKVRNDNLQNEVSMLKTQKLQMEEDIHHTENAIRRLQELVKDALEDSCTEDVLLDRQGVEYFEEMLGKLLDKYKTLLSGLPVVADSVNVHVTEKEEASSTSRDFEEDVATLSKKLEDSLGELMCLKEERDRYVLNNQSLIREVEELERKKKEFEDLLSQEENKSTSLREKLNVAVRKGKSLVQQRDGMKQTIEELNNEVEHLKSEAKHTEKAIHEFEEQVKNLLSVRERLQVVESENSILRDRLSETERFLQEKEGSWSSILDALGEIFIGIESNSESPIEKIKETGRYLHDLRSRLDSLEQESRKSKRAAELLLAELNEVQDRNDGLQDELAKAVHEVSEVSREKESAENAKFEALANAEKQSYVHAEEKDRYLSEIMMLKSDLDNIRGDLSAIGREIDGVLSHDLKVLYNMKAMMKSFLEIGVTNASGASFPDSFSVGVTSTKSKDKVFMTLIGSLRDRLHNHSSLLQEETSQLSEVLKNVHREYTSQKEFCESVNRDVKKFQSIEKEKESGLRSLQANVSLLYETCAGAISKLESLNSQRKMEGHNSLNNEIHNFNEENIRSICDKLLLVLEDFISMRNEVMEVGQREMKSTIMNLQKELQEKDIQRERICMELVNQIKGAETNAKKHLHDLQQARMQLHDSQRQLDVMAEEHKALEQRMKELCDQETNLTDLQQKVNSLTDALAAKVQESEALMHALDEEEVEMENLANKVVRLENELQQKNKDLENLEASRAKALKKLSVTVNKFDELHSLSENLLSEVEKLQSQLQEKDGEISFLRQEVTRCTNDALAVTKMSKKRSSDDIQDLLSWFDSSISRVHDHDVASVDSKSLLVDEYKEVLQKKILNLISELENLRVVAQNRDALLQEERSKVVELTQREQYLKNSLREMGSQQVVTQGVEDSAKTTNSTSEIVEVEQMTNKWAPPGTVAQQVRSLRKINNDQVAVAIDVHDSGERLEDDDDKAHGFKSLTTSKIVPRFTRPVSDMVDGLWVSCDRALMRQPALRLGVIIYWALLHAMVATFVV